MYYLGQILLGGWTYAPEYTAYCSGGIIAVSVNPALYSLLGNNFGGTEGQTFALPDLRGRSPIHFGQGIGLENYPLGAKGGATSVTLVADNLPAHSHEATVSGGLLTGGTNGPTSDPVGNFLGDSGSTDPIYRTNSQGPYDIINGFSGINFSMESTGASTPISIENPYISLVYVMVVKGVFPPRNN